MSGWRGREIQLGAELVSMWVVRTRPQSRKQLPDIVVYQGDGCRSERHITPDVHRDPSLAFSASALLAPRLVARHGAGVLVGGSLLTAAGLVILAAVAGHGSSIAAIVTISALISLGNGLVLPSLVGAALLDVPAAHVGAAAGALTTTQQFASAAGVAVIGTLYFEAAGTDAGTGMAWSASVDAGLVLAVAAAVVYGAIIRRAPPEIRTAGLPTAR
ncbi:hypothetical protein [Kribbella sp. VKM Ac-2566]|uniref:hypothetical protein n=1 Tax=Kribbella sp. VKM Ac-2566 TaxID=2512218 RepID=UPI0010634073|nr:hypothetical protein [Kribbella sp. VKM Ac-2566]TDW92168.1 hypothetical protein EV647_3998 [Kribbella sp. VKM Ac-2566]